MLKFSSRAHGCGGGFFLFKINQPCLHILSVCLHATATPSSEKCTPWGSSARCLLSQTPDLHLLLPGASPSQPGSRPRTGTLHSKSVKIKHPLQSTPASSSLLPVELAVNIQRLNCPDMSTYPIPLSLISMMWINTKYTPPVPQGQRERVTGAIRSCL